MTEPRAMEPFETRLAGRILAYTDAATERGIDALAISRTAMSSRRTTGRSRGLPGTGLLGGRFGDARWAVALVAVVLIGVVGVAVIGRLSDSSASPRPTDAVSPAPSPTASAGGPIPDVLRHAWQRPLPVAPGPDLWGSGFLTLAGGQVEFGRDPAAGSSTSAIAVTGADTVAVTATAGTIGCAIGDVGAYRWLVEGKGTVLTLTAIGADACAAREEALKGPWVRSDLPSNGDGEPTLPPGTHLTLSFDPVGDPAAPVRVSYTVPEGWKVIEDGTATLVLHHPQDAPPGEPTADSFIALLARPRMAADSDPGVACGPVGEAPGGGGGGIDDLVAAIVARPGVVSTPPAAVTIGGHEGRLLDLQLAASWTGGCLGPDGPAFGVPILVAAGSTTGPVVGIGRDHPLRLILLDVGQGRTLAIAIFDAGASQPSQLQAHVAQAMSIVESFELKPPTP